MTQTDTLYRQTAFEGANGLSLLVALYDTVAGNLRRAAAAQRAGNLESRTNELKHALVVVGCLQNWVEPDSGELAAKLAGFYSRLRRRIMEAQAEQSSEILEEEMKSVLALREVWQNADHPGRAAGPEVLPPERPQGYPGFLVRMETAQLSWSA